MDTASRVQVLVEPVRVSLCTKVFAEGMNPSVLSQIIEKTEFFILDLATSLEEGNSEIKPALLDLKIHLLSHILTYWSTYVPKSVQI